MADRGALKLHIKYTAPKNGKVSAGAVHIDVIEGRNLIAIEPYVKVYIVERGKEIKASKQKTQTVKGTPNPVFNEPIKYKLPFPKAEMAEHRVAISVWDKGHMSHKDVGGFSFGLTDLSDAGELDSWFALLDPDVYLTAFKPIGEPEVASIASSKKGKKTDDDAISVTSKKSKAAPKEDSDDGEGRGISRSESLASRADVKREPVREPVKDTKIEEPPPEPEDPSKPPKTPQAGFVHIESRHERATGGDKSAGTLFVEPTELRGLSVASAIIRGVLSKDGKDGRDKVKTSLRMSAGSTRIIKYTDVLEFKLPAGPLDNSSRVQLAVEDSRGKILGGMSFGARDIKEGAISGWFQLLGEQEARGRYYPVDESTVKGGGNNQDSDDNDDAPASLSDRLRPADKKAPPPDSDEEQADVGSRFARTASVQKKEPPPPDSDEEKHSEDEPPVSRFGGRVTSKSQQPPPSDDEHSDDDRAPQPPVPAARNAAPPPAPAGRAGPPVPGGRGPANPPMPPAPPGGAKRGGPAPPGGRRGDGTASEDNRSNASSPASVRAAEPPQPRGGVKRSESLTSLTSIASANIKSVRFVSGTLSLEVEYMAPQNRGREGLLMVKIGQVSGLSAAQPYVKMYLSSGGKDNHASKQKTIVKNGGEAVFNQHFTFKLPLRQQMDGNNFLHVTLWDHKRAAPNECLGGMAFSFEEITEQGKLAGTFKLLSYAEGKTRFEAVRDDVDDHRNGHAAEGHDDERVAELEGEVEELRQQLEESQAEIERLQQANSDLSGRVSNSRGDKSAQAALSSENDALRAQVAEVWAEKESLEARLQEFEAHAAELAQSLQDANDKHAHDIDALQQKLADKVEENSTLRDFIDRLSHELMNTDMKALARASTSMIGSATKAAPAKKGGRVTRRNDSDDDD
eukprot:m.231300 g.231300  ORF g.231300 m.231300 type:complete len:910 (-) comp12193_c0_seq1:92-2821(-)